MVIPLLANQDLTPISSANGMTWPDIIKTKYYLKHTCLPYEQMISTNFRRKFICPSPCPCGFSKPLYDSVSSSDNHDVILTCFHPQQPSQLNQNIFL